ncbi:hypothetical protein CANINC_002844 [Pichia inconspicua]|uniref:Hsp90 chaperone protein kinase-targeting subunit n=1 Tax=Pichia inconspicua TaxID=52247 RepID=A0A4T0X1T2_9ASCO|nr:hypothetical protein CANINC_002844 [[Candida] inconspicua]
MIDYSKWDKLELSDDSDVEVHPNVDKNSFIRWKQRDIHEKRMQREQQIKGLKVQKEMYTQLNKRVDDMLAQLNDEQLSSERERNDYLNSHFDKNEKCTLEEQSDSPPYNEMVEDLLTQITGDLQKEGGSVNGANIRKKVLEHREKIETVLAQIDPKIEEFENEKKQHITSEDIHDGWNSSFLNKSKDEPAKQPETTKSATQTVIETLNTANKVKVFKKPSKPLEELGELELLQETKDFAKLPSIKASCAFLLDHPFIACGQQKDALLMEAFDEELNGKPEDAKKTIRKGILLQFAADILENPPAPNMPLEVRLTYLTKLFDQLENDGTPGKIAYEDECKRMIEHVKTRCKIIQEEKEQEVGEGEGEGEEMVEQIQLRSVDPNTELVVNIPEVGTKEYELYDSLPDEMKEALKTGSLDEVNRVFAKIPVEEAEAMLETFNESGVIGVQALLDNEKQFEELAANERKFEEMRKAAEQVNLSNSS